MLILQRKRDEAVLIGDRIRVVILASDGGGVRIGIEAPDDVSILREEIVEQVRSETVRASRRAAEVRRLRGPIAATDETADPGRRRTQPPTRIRTDTESTTSSG